MPDRWTIYVCTGCGKATGRHKDCDGKREAVEVVPAAEVERLREALRYEESHTLDDATKWRVGRALEALKSQLTP